MMTLEPLPVQVVLPSCPAREQVEQVAAMGVPVEWGVPWASWVARAVLEEVPLDAGHLLVPLHLTLGPTTS